MSHKKILCCMLALTAVITGCRDRFVFDQGEYEKIVEQTFPTDSVDPNHDWKVYNENTVHVTSRLEGTTRVVVLLQNPQTTAQAEIAAEQMTTAGQSMMLTCLLPKAQQELWVAAFDRSNRLMAIKQIAATTHICTLTESDVPVSTSYKMMSRQRTFYLYETDFPRPGDWDYNDIVLAIDAAQPGTASDTVSMDRQKRTVRLHVTLQAVGCTEMVAAAIRMPGISFESVDSITTRSYRGRGFVRNETYPRAIIKDAALLQRSRNGEAVLCLFDDAHLSIYSRADASGMVYRYLFNVSHGTAAGYAEFPAAEVDYEITFRDSITAQLFSTALLDPFIIVPYNGANWEIHQYQHRLQQTMFEYVSKDQGNFHTGYSWCLVMPYKWYRYPTEGRPLGRLRNGALSGVYSTLGHSFAEWVVDRRKSVDWYLYPTTSLTY